MKKVWLWIAAIVVLALAALTWHISRGYYFTVIEDKAYRGAQMDGERLKDFVQELGIRTIVNLRPIREDSGWYEEEVATVEALGIELRNAPLSQTTPRVDSIRGLRKALEDIEWPVFFHCGSGVDRTGLAAVMVLLLEGDYSPEEVEREVSWHHGAIRDESTGRLFLSQYQAWLTENNKQHSPQVFDDWLANHYVDPSGNFHFYIHPIRGQPWPRPLGLYDEGVSFDISRDESPLLHMDGWAFDTENEQPLAGLSFSLGGVPMVDAQYGLDSSWLIEDFGKEQYLRTGWAIDQPLKGIDNGCHDLRITFERLNGETWQTPPAARICITP